MIRQTIIIDSDGVLAKCIEKVVDNLKVRFNIDIKISDLTSGNLLKFEHGEKMINMFKNPGFFRDLEPMDESRYYLKRLIDEGHDVIIATASPYEAIVDKYEWIKEYFSFIKEENIIAISRKDLLLGTIMLDDGLHNIINSNCNFAVIFNQPWNEKLTTKYKSLENNPRVKNWKEFYEFVQLVSIDLENAI